MTRKELKEKIENIEITYDYEETYNNLFNTCVEYMNESQTWDLERPFEEFVDYEVAEDIGRQEFEKGGLERMRYYIGDTNFWGNEIFRINAYGNLENIYKEDLEMLKEEILEVLDNEE